ncbi:hypothetical protein Fot_03510 [Forsythia ovata]|uniref:Uncharacterized protein n=1 Tax=Forsythia ovata TaxID=205694 RepID=A0ABD1XAJ0_9LAMI
MGENDLKRQNEHLENIDFNPKRQRDEVPEVVVSDEGEVQRKNCIRRYKMSIANIVSNLAEQVQILVEANTRSAITGGQANDEERSWAEVKAPSTSHSHPYSEPQNYRRYQPADLLKERERRPARSTSIFDRLCDEGPIL